MGRNKENISSNDTEFVGLLGGVPHTVRGSLWNYDMQLTITHRFTACTACSAPVITEYKNRGLSFVIDACNVPNYLEKLSGLEQILKRTDLDEVRVYNDIFICTRMLLISLYIYYYVFLLNRSCVTLWII